MSMLKHTTKRIRKNDLIKIFHEMLFLIIENREDHKIISQIYQIKSTSNFLFDAYNIIVNYKITAHDFLYAILVFQKAEKSALAFSMGKHKRLGKDSQIKNLPHEIINKIVIEHVKQILPGADKTFFSDMFKLLKKYNLM